ncbi:secondary thiamine-phosphate synthase enzyme YjbQ [Sporofaciens sp. SGI.106]|uniref:secondary thiamine-phosphate synthase enzyme YjbQ n=1 Tax=Sporofaciens sp. SGI.106 TaxID=3420568 RepID=UPI002A9B5228|nr:secondary thiamine-phosphate synthase enzyme YjbQ [Lachnoclostridium sp.]
MHVYEHHLSTKGPQQMTKITSFIREDIKKSGVQEGIAVVFSPHTTAGFTINENADPDVVRDMLYGYEKVFPTHAEYYRHAEGNSHAHMKTTLVGPSQTIIIHNGEILFGIWQDLYFCEFDGPRSRRFYVKILEG